jgi:hypothetical protein
MLQRHINNFTHIEDKIQMSLSQIMLNILERLAEMFPNDGYQNRLETYLGRHSITDAAILDNLIKEFEYKSHKEF